MSAIGRYCCKSPKLMRGNFPARGRSKSKSPIDMASGSLPKSPVSLSLGDEVPHMCTRKTRQRLGKNLPAVQKDFCNNIGTFRTSRHVRATVAIRGKRTWPGRRNRRKLTLAV